MIARATIAILAALAPLAPTPGSAGLPEIDPAAVEIEPTNPPRTQRWVLMELDTAYPERRGPFTLFNQPSVNFWDLLATIDEARGDEEVSGLILRIEGPGLGWSQIQSLRRAIAQFRESGKEAVAYLTEAEMPEYLLATACDSIAMAPEGTLMVTGLHLEGIFLRGLLDLLGIQPDILQIGIYKGAGDMFTERAFTEPLRQALTGIVDDLWDQVLTTIAESRGLERAEVARLIDRGPFTARQALAAGLIDQLAQPTDLLTRIEIAAGDGFTLDDAYGVEEPPPLETNIFNLLAMFQQPAAETASPNPKIALLYATGLVLVAEPQGGLFAQPEVIASDTFTDLLRQCRDDETVRAVVVRVDSPGGSALASDIIWQEMRALARIKPVIVSMGDLAASGGYYVAIGGDEIFAEPGTLTGSIGVMGGKLVLAGLLEGHLGITHDTISRGQNAGMFSAWAPFSPTEREALEGLMQSVYETFKAHVAESRDLTPEEVEAVAQGRAWTGRQAVERGLADRIGGLPDAIARAEELAGLSDAEREQLQILELPRPKSFVEWLSDMMSGQLVARAVPPGLSSPLPLPRLQLLSQITLLQTMFQREHVLALMPLAVQVR